MITWKYERRAITSKEVALLATMGTLAAALRIPFAVVMSVQPATFIIMITGYVFGAGPGFIVGMMTPLVSNFFLGQGPWTPWQMLAWGLSGAGAALLASKEKRFNIKTFTVLSGLWGYIFGWIMNIWHWLGFIYPLTFSTFFATYAISFPADTMHGVGNIVFSLTFGKTFYNILSRYKKKITVVNFTEK